MLLIRVRVQLLSWGERINIEEPKTEVKYNLRICNGNRTEWSPIQSVIIRLISKIGRPRSRSLICIITSMITDQIGRHNVLLPINHNFNKICDIISYNFKSKHKKFKILFC